MPDAQNGRKANTPIKAPSARRGWTRFVSNVKSEMHKRRAKEQEESSMDRAARRTATATIWMAVFTVILAATSIGTAWILKNQLGEMHEGGIDTHNLATAADRIDDAADSFSKSSTHINQGVSDAVTKLGQQADDSESFFRTDERAWVVIDQISVLESHPADATFPPHFKYGLYAKNVGKTVARDVRIHIDAFFGSSPLNKNGVERTQMRTWRGDEGKVFGPDKAGPQSLAPGERSTVPVTAGGQAPRNDWYDTLVGRIDYTDAFSVHHWKTFCYYMSDDKGTLNHCVSGNDEDQNPEMPTGKKR